VRDGQVVNVLGLSVERTGFIPPLGQKSVAIFCSNCFL